MNRKTIIVSGVIILIGLIIGVTYAWFTWNTTPEQNTVLNIRVEGADIIYDGGTDITGVNLNPTYTKGEGILKEVTLALGNSTINVCADLNLELTTLPIGLVHESFKYEVYKNDTLVGMGNFADQSEGNTIKLATSQEITSVTDTYKIYIWIDGTMRNPEEMQGQTFSFRLNVNAVDSAECNPSYVSIPNAPELFEGLIPVKWENNVLIKADVSNPNNNLWYDYDAKMWANAIMVTSETRESYMNASVGTPITESDILAYWVWIPRYRYELFNTEFASGTTPQTINIVFESASTTKSTGTTNGSMLTHPAFTFGSAELDGFWIAKFEPSGAATAGSLKVLPGVASLRNMTVGAQYTASGQFANTAYLTDTGITQVDPHMTKNTEWGAVAYLSHSLYGKNAEITINSNSSYYTGGGTGTAYITNVGQSTTENVYGVYDMSGGAWEYVMGNYNNTTGSSDLTVTSINIKYVDIYTGDTVASSILGDAVGETAGWYGDYANFIISNSPWFHRGGYYNEGTYAGAFDFYAHYGDASTRDSFRPALSAK